MILSTMTSDHNQSRTPKNKKTIRYPSYNKNTTTHRHYKIIKFSSLIILLLSPSPWNNTNNNKLPTGQIMSVSAAFLPPPSSSLSLLYKTPHHHRRSNHYNNGYFTIMKKPTNNNNNNIKPFRHLRISQPDTTNEINSSLSSSDNNNKRRQQDENNNNNKVNLPNDIPSIIKRLQNISFQIRHQRPLNHQLRYALLHLLPSLSSQQIPSHLSLSLTTALSHAIIPSLHAAAEVNDYSYILKLMMTISLRSSYTSLLPPRIFGESLLALSRTTANVSKIKSLRRGYETWLSSHHDEMTSHDDNDSSSPSSSSSLLSFNDNAYLYALLSRSKIRAVLSFYDTMPRHHKDGYTASLVLKTLLESFESSKGSETWQWNEALRVLDDCEGVGNEVFGLALKLNNVMEGGVKGLNDVLERMTRNNIIPDVISCTNIISTLSKNRDNDSALLSLLTAMQHQQQHQQESPHSSSPTSSPTTSLPPPTANTILSHLLSSPSEATKARHLLHQSKKQDGIDNIWINNAILTAHRDNTTMIMALLNAMEEQSKNNNTDVISYNIALSSLGRRQRRKKKKNLSPTYISKTIHKLLNRMTMLNISRDERTYHNAIMSLRGSSTSKTVSTTVLRLLRRGFDDTTLPLSSHHNVLNSALSLCASYKNVTLMEDCLIMARESNILKEEEEEEEDDEAWDTTIYLVMKTYGRVGRHDLVCDMLRIMEGSSDGGDDDNTALKVGALTSRLVSKKRRPKGDHYAAAILSCLQAQEIKTASSIFQQMIKNNTTTTTTPPPNESVYEMMIRYCCRHVKQRHSSSSSDDDDDCGEYLTLAHQLLTSRTTPSSDAVGDVAGAYAAMGRWDDAMMLLRRLHDGNDAADEKHCAAVERLHLFLLGECARTVNVEGALELVDEIQKRFGRDDADDDLEVVADDDDGQSRIQHLSSSLHRDADYNMTSSPKSPSPHHHHPSSSLSMTPLKYKLLIVTASLSHRWPICLTSLPHLYPFLSSSSSPTDRIHLRQSLSLTLRTLEKSNQSIWSPRLIRDWTSRGGEVSPSAIVASCRGLCQRGMGNEVVNLLSSLEKKKRVVTREVLSSVIASCYRNGLYDCADEIYAMGIADGRLTYPVAIVSSTTEDDDDDDDVVTIDLHGLSLSLAHSLVRLALQKEYVLSSSPTTTTTTTRHLLIITGRGKRSSITKKPILRPEVQRLLMDEFYPPLNSVTVPPRNVGALTVNKKDVERWVRYQRKMRGRRMMVVADMLRDVAGMKKLTTGIFGVGRKERRGGGGGGEGEEDGEGKEDNI